MEVKIYGAAAGDVKRGARCEPSEEERCQRIELKSRISTRSAAGR